MAGHIEVRRFEERFDARLKVHIPDDQTKCTGENSRPFRLDLGCLVRRAAPNWGNQRWKDIPANEKDALFMKLEENYEFIGEEGHAKQVVMLYMQQAYSNWRYKHGAA